MRTFIRTISLALACLASCLAVGAAANAAQASVAPHVLCSTSQTIEFADLSFHPPAVAPGGTSQAVATLVNCTAIQQKASTEWLGHWVGPSTGLPAGCPVIDPLVLGVTLAPHATASATVGYLVPASCTATQLVVTVEVIQNGTVIAQRSAALQIVRPTAAPARTS